MIRNLCLIFVPVLLALGLTSCGHSLHRDAHSTQPPPPHEKQALVIMTDFGLKDGAVSAMKGVAYGVSKDLLISDLTHEIPAYNIWEAAYRLKQTSPYWPTGTVFVVVVDPGVGSARKSVVVRSQSGNYFVGPDNGHLTLINEIDPPAEVRQIDEKRNRLKGSEESYTFHGRDLYSYVGAQLASGRLKFDDVGPVLSEPLVKISYEQPRIEDAGKKLVGGLPALDPQYGNVWTNIPKKMLLATFPDAKNLKVVISKKGKVLYQARLPLMDTFAGVPEGKPLLYFNSLLNLSLALNMDNFAAKYKVGSGPEWKIEVTP